MIATAKPRIRVPARSVAVPVAAQPTQRRAVNRWARDTPSGVLASRRTSLIDSREDIRRVWDRVSALAIDFIQNSGRLKGIVDQVIADTVGTGLQLSARPKLLGLGYDEGEAKDWARQIEEAWNLHAWSAREFDTRGKFDLATQVDIALRHYIAYGEAIQAHDYFGPALRRRYRVKTGVKACLISPHRLVRETDEFKGLFDGVYHDETPRVVAYRLKERRDGMDVIVNRSAFDRDGRPMIVHVFDPWDGSDTRGVSPLASAMRNFAHSERLNDVTLETAILQTFFAASITSPNPSEDAFKAIQQLDADDESGYAEQFVDYLSGRMTAAADGTVAIGSSPQISHLGPGETLTFHGAPGPGPGYEPLATNFMRELARTIGTTYSAASFDFNGATYSTVRMEGAAIEPVVIRRRERIAAPVCQAAYENWLDERIFTGKTPLKGGYEAWLANRDLIAWTEWQGPARPTADDEKSARAATERMQNGTSTLEIECAALGRNAEDVFAARLADHKRYVAAGMTSPYERVQGGAKDKAANDDSEPESPKKTPAKAA